MKEPDPKQETSIERAMKKAREEKKKKSEDAPEVDKMQRAPVIKK